MEDFAALLVRSNQLTGPDRPWQSIVGSLNEISLSLMNKCCHFQKKLNVSLHSNA